MKVRDLMTTPVDKCSPTDSLDRAVQIMWQTDRGCLPVVDTEDHVLGIITDRDACIAAHTRDVPLTDIGVSSIMSRAVCTCSPDDRAAAVERLMQKFQVRRIPVVDENSRMIGIVSLADFAHSAHENAVRLAASGPGVAKTLSAITQKTAAAIPRAAE